MKVCQATSGGRGDERPRESEKKRAKKCFCGVFFLGTVRCETGSSLFLVVGVRTAHFKAHVCYIIVGVRFHAAEHSLALYRSGRKVRR